MVMTILKIKKIGSWAALIGLCVMVPLGADSDYEPLHARVSFDSGAGMVRGTADEDWSYAPTNTIVLPGDTLWVDKRGTLEVELAGGSFLRLADGSKVEVVQLAPHVLLRAWQGSFYIHRLRRSTGTVTLATPACEVLASPDSLARVDIVGDGSTTVSVRWGQVTVQAANEQVSITEGRRVFVDAGLLPSAPVFFDRTAEDDFDIWNRERVRLLAIGEDPARTPVKLSRMPIGIYDLAPYGEWVYIESVPYWRPTLVVNYVPYREGHWSFVAGIGYVWVETYPFSYVTTHYGRWWCHPTYGWVWTYRDAWAPAWCATVRYGPYLVWSPLDPFDRPIVIGTATFRVGDVDFSITASSYCRVDDIFVGCAPVYPCTPTIVSTVVPATQIYVWNTWVSDRRPREPVFRSPGLLVRDYSPRRVIRGPSVSSFGATEARARVATLESSLERPQFQTLRETSSPSVRTSIAESIRRSSVRAANVAPEAREPLNSTLRRVREVVPSVVRTEGTETRLVRRPVSSREARTEPALPRLGGVTTNLNQNTSPNNLLRPRSVRQGTPDRYNPNDAGDRFSRPIEDVPPSITPPSLGGARIETPDTRIVSPRRTLTNRVAEPSTSGNNSFATPSPDRTTIRQIERTPVDRIAPVERTPVRQEPRVADSAVTSAPLRLGGARYNVPNPQPSIIPTLPRLETHTMEPPSVAGNTTNSPPRSISENFSSPTPAVRSRHNASASFRIAPPINTTPDASITLPRKIYRNQREISAPLPILSPPSRPSATPIADSSLSPIKVETPNPSAGTLPSLSGPSTTTMNSTSSFGSRPLGTTPGSNTGSSFVRRR